MVTPSRLVGWPIRVGWVMRKPNAFFAAILASTALVACASQPLGVPFQSNGSQHRGSASSPIQHVVILIQENRSFDNLFATFPGANGATYGCARTSFRLRSRAPERTLRGFASYDCPSGDQVIPLHASKLTMGSDLQHCHAAFVTDYDGGNMDGFYLEGKGVCTGHMPPPAKTLPYQYVSESYIKPYWEIAKEWVLGDETFQTQGSSSFTAHQDLIRGNTCIEACGAPSASTESLVDTPSTVPWGCNANKTVRTSIINIYGVVQAHKGPFPCSNAFPNYSSSPGYETLRDELDGAGISWKYYTPCFKSEERDCTKPNKQCEREQHPGNCDATTLNAFDVIYPVWSGPEWGTNVSWPETNIFADVSGGALPAVSWVIPSDADNDHPGESVDKGPEWVASVVNAIGKSSYWDSSVIIVVWDDWGGFYDNAAPKQFTDVSGGLGFRVPMLVISPYAIAGSGSKGGYISHTKYEFGSILKYIEHNWGLGSLGTSDARATSIGDVFNYGQTPRAFTPIRSTYNAQYFVGQPHTPQRGDPE
jgi:phospholipase C